jgi:S-layer homology domain
LPCAWTASTAATFIHITSGAASTGTGAVQYSVDANPGSTIRSDTITIGGHTFTVYQGINFLDVPSNDVFYTVVGQLSARGVTLGCGNGNYCPNDPVTREQMAAFILRAKGEFSPPTPASQRFNDVPPQNVFYNFIDRLAVLQITLGCTPDHLFYCPSDPVKREQMSAFILRGLGEFNPPTPGSQRFSDVPPANVFYNFIDRLAVLQITLGCTPDHLMYCPNDSVTRAQMAAFLVRAFNL